MLRISSPYARMRLSPATASWTASMRWAFLVFGRATPIEEMLVEQTLQLPRHPALEPAQQERVLAALDAVQGG
jgi:dTDP-4-amino-4,6-dideoxygalactose transaminase